MEVESVETQQRYYPDDGEVTQDVKQWYEAHPNVGNFWEKLKKLTNFESATYTEYVELD